MPAERDIEERLRDYGGRRREQAGQPELHPVTRRLLQEEVARVYAQPGHRLATPRSLLASLWPRLAFGSAIVLALVSAVWLLNSNWQKQNEPMLVALKTQPVSQERPEPPAPPGTLPADLAAGVSLKKAEGALPREAEKLAKDELQREKAPTQVVRRYGLAPAPEPEKTRAVSTSLASAPTPAAAPAAGRSLTDDHGAPTGTAASQPAFQNTVQNLTTIQRFSNRAPARPSATIRRAKAAASDAPVLASFQIEQTGDTLRIVDKDGSVYVGTLLNATPAGSEMQFAPQPLQLAETRSKAAQEGVANLAQAAQNYAFEVVGTNRTLKQKVVFRGTVTENLDAISQSPQSQGRTQFQNQVSNRQFSNVSNLSNSQVQFLNTRITGKAVVGTGKEVEVEAVPY